MVLGSPLIQWQYKVVKFPELNSEERALNPIYSQGILGILSPLNEKGKHVFQRQREVAGGPTRLVSVV